MQVELTDKNSNSVKSKASYRVEYQPQLVEEAVLRAITGHKLESVFRQERDNVYNITDTEVREETFQVLHQRWYERLNLDAPLQAVLTDWPVLKEYTFRCLVIKAQSRKQIGAELFVAEENSRESCRENQTIILQLSPEMVIQTDSFYQFLRRELLHVVDMLNPEFGYEPNLPGALVNPTYNRLMQERYRVLWDIVVDGRLIRAGCLTGDFKDKHWKIFKSVFQGPDRDLKSVFDFFFYNTSPKHRELVSFAMSPGNWFVNKNVEAQSNGICSLCQFPSNQLQDATVTLSRNIIDKIQKNHTEWKPQFPICLQCSDLYSVAI